MIKVQKAGYNGIYLPDYRLAMDASHKDAEHVFVSHAHADHIPSNRSTTVFCTRPTAKLLKKRGFQGKTNSREFNVTFETSVMRITLYPAGHILGSSMIYIETDEGTLLYTGDCRTPPSPASEGFKIPDQADTLIVDATFSLPIYKWESLDQLALEIRTFAVKALDDGFTPIFLGYNLGKAQELLHMLAPLNHPMQIHGAGYKLCNVYDEEGVDLGDYHPYDRETCEGKILITTSSALNNGFASNVKKKKIAYCSGWAVHESRRTQLTVDKLIPLSDHLDFFEMIHLCKSLDPRKIFISHSPNPDVMQHYLEKLNFETESI